MDHVQESRDRVVLFVRWATAPHRAHPPAWVHATRALLRHAHCRCCAGEKGVELKELKKAATEIEKEERERLAKLQRERGQLRNALAPSFLVGKNGGEQGKGVMMANEV
jgi:hypothetical protein